MKKLSLSIAGIFCAVKLLAATYYVDFDGGSDAAAGTSIGTAWKHCRGDANATGTAASTTLTAGDTINFKGGVRYYGKISATASGNNGSRIVYQGDASAHGWGTGKAIIDGTTNVTWTVCTANGTNATEVPNANFASIYYAPIPGGGDVLIPVLEGDTWLNMTTTATTNPSRFAWQNTDYFHAMSSGVGATTTTDAARFNQSSSDYWVGAYVLVHVAGSVGGTKITAFDTSTDTITYGSVGTPYLDTGWDSKYHYAVVNNPRLIAAAGDYAIDENRGLMFVWPLTNSANVRVAGMDGAFEFNGGEYITFTGFATTGHYGGYQTGRIVRTPNSSGYNGVIIANCDFKNSADRYTVQSSGATYIRGAGTVVSYVTNCTYRSLHNRGAFVTGVLTAVKDSYFDNIDQTAIYTQNFSTEENTDGIISGNTVTNCYGVHMNGITVYGAAGGAYPAKRWIVTGNKVYGFVQRQGPGGFTAQGFWDLEFSNNFIEADQGVPIDGPYAGSTYIRIFNNTVVIPNATQGNASRGIIRCYNLTNNTLLDFRNNICHGFVIANEGSGSGISWPRVAHSYNLYTGLTSAQSAGNGWTLAGTESTNTPAAIFTDATGGNWTPKAAGPAIGTGTNLSSYLSVDLAGTVWVDPWGIGAWAEPVAQASSRSPTLFQGNIRAQGSVIFR